MDLRTYQDIGKHLRPFGCKDLDATQNPNFELIALGGDLTVQPLSNFEPFEDHS